MERKDLLDLFKFYKEEKDNPFVGIDPMEAKWWEGEKSLLMMVDNDDSAWNRIADAYREAFNNKNVSGALVDERIIFDQRVIFFYLDLWNGKYYPYDSLDDIFEYIKV